MADLEQAINELATITDRNLLVERFMSLVPFNQVLGIEVEAVSEGYVRMSIPFREELIGDPIRRALHGGVISSLIDTCGGAAVWTTVEIGDRVSTVDLRVDYLRPGLPQALVVEGRVLRAGNRVGVADMTVYHPSARDEPIATGKGVYNVRRAEGSK